MLIKMFHKKFSMTSQRSHVLHSLNAKHYFYEWISKFYFLVLILNPYLTHTFKVLYFIHNSLFWRLWNFLNFTPHYHWLPQKSPKSHSRDVCCSSQFSHLCSVHSLLENWVLLSETDADHLLWTPVSESRARALSYLWCPRVSVSSLSLSVDQLH